MYTEQQLIDFARFCRAMDEMRIREDKELYQTVDLFNTFFNNTPLPRL